MARKSKKTIKNPHGLSPKQSLVVEDMVEKVKQGKPLSPVDSHEKIYDVSSRGSAQSISSRNMRDNDFRAALIAGLNKKQVLGPDGKLERVLDEGLDAVDKEGYVDYSNRLNYVKEINKVTGVYAPQKLETKRMSLTMDISEDELDKKIAELKEELAL